MRRLLLSFFLLPATIGNAFASSESLLDTGFNFNVIPAVNSGIGQGSAIVDYNNLGGGFDVARGIERLPDGRLMVISLVNPGPDGKLALARLLPDGSYDASFGPANQQGRLLRHDAVTSIGGIRRYGDKLYYAFTQTGSSASNVYVCRIDFDGVADAAFRSWGYADWPAGCSRSGGTASTLAYGSEVSDLDVQQSTGWVVTALTYRPGSASNLPSNGAFTLMDDTGADPLGGVPLSGSPYKSPVYHDVTAGGDHEAARRVHFSRAAGAATYDFFIAYDYQPASGPRLSVVRRYDGMTSLQESGGFPGSVGALAFETGPANLGFDAAALLLINTANGSDPSGGTLFRPTLTRLPISQSDGSLGAAFSDDVTGFCNSLAGLIAESCLINQAVYDRVSQQVWMVGSWRAAGNGEVYTDVLLGRLRRVPANGDYRYQTQELSGGSAFARYSFNGGIGETRRHWGAAMLLDNLQRPVIAGDRQLVANNPADTNHSALLVRVRGSDRIFTHGFEVN